MLGDADNQQSSKYWLTQRPKTLPHIRTWEYQADLVLTAKPPPDITRLVIDTPGALDGWRLKEVVARADVVIVPILPSAFDVQATKAFLTTLSNLTKDQHGLSMFDISPSKVEKDLIQWESICSYLDNL